MNMKTKKINYRRVEKWALSYNKDISDFILIENTTFKVCIPVIATNDSTKEEIMLLPGITYECSYAIQMLAFNDNHEYTCNMFLFLDIKINDKHSIKSNWGVFASAEEKNVEVEYPEC
jgi:hypothetical protein